MRKWAYRFSLFVAALLLGYWLVIKAVLLWVQYVPNHFFNTLESVLGIDASAEQIQISQNWNHASIHIRDLHLKTSNWSFESERLQTDVNFFYVWLPFKPVGERLQLENALLSLKNKVHSDQSPSFSLSEINRYIHQWPVGRLWKRVRLINSGVKAQSPHGSVQVSFKRFQSYYGLRWSFGGIADVRLNQEPATRVQVKGDFRVHRIRGLRQGKASLNVLSPLNLDLLYQWFPQVWQDKLPSGELLGNVSASLAQYQWNDVRIGLQAQDLLWPENDAFLPENLALDVKIDKTKLDTALKKGNWNFLIEKVRMNNAYVERLSPVLLTLKESNNLSFSVEQFDLAPVESLFKLTLKTLGVPELTESVQTFNLKNVTGLIKLSDAHLAKLAFEMPELTVAHTPANNLPGLVAKGLHFDLEDHKAKLSLDEPLKVTYPEWFSQSVLIGFKEPLVVALQDKGDKWQLSPNVMLLDAIPISVDAKSGGRNHLELRADTYIKNLATLKRYLPYSVMSKPLETWLKAALVKGKNLQWDLYLNGNLDDFPFENGKGVFLAHAQMEDAELKFQPDWPALTGFNAKLEFVPYRLKITSDKAHLDNVHVRNVEVLIDKLHTKNIALDIKGQSNARLENALAFLNNTPLTKKPELKRFLTTKLQAAGDVDVDLSRIWVPVYGYDDKETQVSGAATVKGGQVTLFDQLKFDQVRGHVFFTEKSAKTKKPLTFQFEHGKGNLTLDTQNKTLFFTGEGHANLDYPYLKGPTDWTTKVAVPFEKDPITIAASSTLNALKTFLPAPLNDLSLEQKMSEKTGDLAAEKTALAQINVKILPDFTEARGHVSNLGAFLFNWEGEESKLSNAKVVFGPGALVSSLSNEKGLAFGGHLPLIQGDLWLKKWSDLPWLSNAKNDSHLAWMPSIIKVDQLTFKDQIFHNLIVNLDHINEQKISQLAFNVKADEFSLVGKQTAEKEYDVFLSNLKWRLPKDDVKALPETATKEVNNNNGLNSNGLQGDSLLCEVREHSFPSVNFSGENLVIGDKRIRNVHFRMDDLPDALKLTNISLSLGKVDGALQGNYVYQKMASQSRLNMRLETKDVEDLAEFAGVKKGFSGKKGILNSDLVWPGDYTCYALQNVKGNLSFEVQDGVIKDADPGLARILGLLSFESLARRLQLDLKDITNQGLVFNSIKGSGELKKGVLDLSKFVLKAPAANATMTGLVNLNNETLDLTAEVTPAIGSTLPAVAIISGIATPIAGLAAYALLKAVPSVNEDLVTYKYRVTGTFENPDVKDKGPSIEVIRKK